MRDFLDSAVKMYYELAGPNPKALKLVAMPYIPDNELCADGIGATQSSTSELRAKNAGPTSGFGRNTEFYAKAGGRKPHEAKAVNKSIKTQAWTKGTKLSKRTRIDKMAKAFRTTNCYKHEWTTMASGHPSCHHRHGHQEDHPGRVGEELRYRAISKTEAINQEGASTRNCQQLSSVLISLSTFLGIDHHRVPRGVLLLWGAAHCAETLEYMSPETLGGCESVSLCWSKRVGKSMLVGNSLGTVSKKCSPTATKRQRKDRVITCAAKRDAEHNAEAVVEGGKVAVDLGPAKTAQRIAQALTKKPDLCYKVASLLEEDVLEGMLLGSADLAGDEKEKQRSHFKQSCKKFKNLPESL
eukprot:1062067-Amphidinium_carterae.2